MPRMASHANRAGTATAAASGNQTTPRRPATAAKGNASATSGPIARLAGRLTSENPPEIGSRIGSVASWATNVARNAPAIQDRQVLSAVTEATAAIASEATNESWNERFQTRTGSTTTMAAAARTIRVTISGRRPATTAKVAPVATMAARVAGGLSPTNRA
jgi:hypothetical protein